MNSIHLIFGLILSSLTLISGQSEPISDLVSSETSVLPQWMAPPQVNIQSHARPVRRTNVHLNNQSPENVMTPSAQPNKTTLMPTIMRSNVSATNQNSNSGPPYAANDFRGVMNNNNINGSLRRLMYSGLNHTNTPANMIRSNYVGHGLPGYKQELIHVLTVAAFSLEKCDGPDKAEYTVQFRFNRNKLCTRYALFTIYDINTITSKIGVKMEVSQFVVYFIFTEDNGGHKIIFMFGFIYTGNLQGKYIVIKLIYDQWQVAHKCGGMLTTHLESDTTTVFLLELDLVKVAQCYGNPPHCMDNLKSSAQTVCQGKAVIA